MDDSCLLFRTGLSQFNRQREVRCHKRNKGVVPFGFSRDIVSIRGAGDSAALPEFAAGEWLSYLAAAPTSGPLYIFAESFAS